MVSLVPSTPRRPRWSRTDCARRSDSARLYSWVPRGSVWPISVTLRPTFFRQSASRASAAVASVVSADSLKSKNAASSLHSVGGGGGAFSATQNPSTQSSFCAQSFSLLHGFFAVQVPLMQCWPPGHSLSAAQALHRLARHSWSAGQSDLLRQ